MNEITGVVAMIHGSASDLDDQSIRDYLGRIMRGRDPTAEQVDDLRRRYTAIGGPSHLLERTRGQVDAVASALGPSFKVLVGAKHSDPFIPSAVKELAQAGARRVIGVALAPHESRLTTGQYDDAGARAAAEAGVDWSMLRSWHLEPALISLWVDLLSEVLDTEKPGARILFTAHSVPRVPGDPYPQQVRQTAEAIAAALELQASDWTVVYQSVPPGADASGWLGPNLADSYPAGGRAVVAPIGFVSDHLEVLYDIDIQAREEAAAVGAELKRTRMPNDDPRLGDAVAAALASG